MHCPVNAHLYAFDIICLYISINTVTVDNILNKVEKRNSFGEVTISLLNVTIFQQSLVR